MNEELKAMLGEAYKEDMTLEDVGNFFKGKKFADLSSGNYVDKGKFDNETSNLKKQLKEQEATLKSKLSEEELKAQDVAAKDKLIEELQNSIKEGKISTNKLSAKNQMADIKTILELDDTNTEFSSFIDNLTSDNGETTTNLSKYVNKLVKDAYEKGKKDSTKDALGNFGKGKVGSENKDVESLGKQLASNTVKPVGKQVDYFNKNK